MYILVYMYTYTQACQQEREKKSENFSCSLSRLAKPGEHVSWGFGGRCKPPPPHFFGILDVLRVNLRHLMKII